MRRFLELGNGVYVVFGDDGLMYLGAKMNNNVYADTSRGYSNLHSFKGGILLLNKEETTYVVLKDDANEIMYGTGFVDIGTDVFISNGIYTLENGFISGEDAIIYTVRKYGDTEFINDLLGVLIGKTTR